MIKEKIRVREGLAEILYREEDNMEIAFWVVVAKADC